MRKLDPAIKKIWTVKYGLYTAAAVLAAAVYELPALFTGGDRALPTGALTLGLLTVGLAATLLVPRLRYRFWAFALDTDELLLERGVWKRVYTVVPLRRIQHLDVSRNLLEREFDLGRLIVYTAGTQGNRVVLPGLRYDEAERLRDTLKHYILDDAL